MAPKLSRIERKELENTIISKHKGEIKMMDEEIAKIFPRCTEYTKNYSHCPLKYYVIGRVGNP